MTTEEKARGSVQSLTQENGGRTEIELEVSEGEITLMVNKDVGDNDETWATAHMTRDELWEHIHNCLYVMTLLPK